MESHIKKLTKHQFDVIVEILTWMNTDGDVLQSEWSDFITNVSCINHHHIHQPFKNIIRPKYTRKDIPLLNKWFKRYNEFLNDNDRAGT
jgi:(p)ppGpp synthase/HD superfamily hydrolase